jgi:hypothetical protein
LIAHRTGFNGHVAVSNRQHPPNTYEGGYAAARPCNGKELLSVAGLSPLPYWELFLGRPPGVKKGSGHNSQLLHALVYRRCRTCSAFARWLGAQGLFDPIEMSATMHRTPQDARLPPHLDLRHHLR